MKFKDKPQKSAILSFENKQENVSSQVFLWKLYTHGIKFQEIIIMIARLDKSPINFL